MVSPPWDICRKPIQNTQMYHKEYKQTSHPPTLVLKGMSKPTIHEPQWNTSIYPNAYRVMAEQTQTYNQITAGTN